MALTGSTIASTYLKLLRVNTDTMGADASASYIQDSADTDSALSISTTRVGIGTAAPASALTIVGDNNNLTLASADFSLVYLGSKASTGAALDDAYFELKSDATTKILLDTTGSSYFIGGKVGIGTAAPTTQFHIYESVTGQVLFGDSGTNLPTMQLYREDTSIGDTHALGVIEWAGKDNAGAARTAHAKLQVIADGDHASGDNPTAFAFYTTPDGSSTMAEAMRINSSGDVTFTGDLIMADGKGIDFSADASPAAGMTAEILDDYEEGSGTLTTTGAGGSEITLSTSGGVTIAGGNYEYTKVGNIVHFSFEFQTTGVSSPVGALQIPIPFVGVSAVYVAGALRVYSETFDGSPFLSLDSGASVLACLCNKTASGNTAITPTAGNRYYFGQITYRTSA